MVRGKKLNEGLEEFLQKYPITHPVQMNEEYRTVSGYLGHYLIIQGNL